MLIVFAGIACRTPNRGPQPRCICLYVYLHLHLYLYLHLHLHMYFCFRFNLYLQVQAIYEPEDDFYDAVVRSVRVARVPNSGARARGWPSSFGPLYSSLRFCRRVKCVVCVL